MRELMSPPLPTLGIVLTTVLLLASCTKTSEVSKQKAHGEVEVLAKAASIDVEEVRKGLPLGAKLLEAFFADDKAQGDAAVAKEALNTARSKIQDLRTAKSTFFLVADKSGVILRRDLEHDALASKNLLSVFDLKGALGGKYSEARGSMPEASAVRGRGDGQWAAAMPVMRGNEVAGL